MSSDPSSYDTKEFLLWAVDPTQDPESAQAILREISVWSAKMNYRVQPVTVISRNLLRFPLDLNLQDDNESIARVKKSTLQFLDKSGATKFSPPEIILIDEASTRKKALALSKWAEAKKAAMIFANTRAKPGRKLLRLGGFSETLAGTSRIPVLFINPEAIVTKRIPAILFPTDFSRDSKNALALLEPWAKAFNSKLLIFNQLEGPIYYQSAFAGYGEYGLYDWSSYMAEVEKVRGRHANAWKRVFDTKGIECETILQPQNKSTSEDILETALRHDVSLIVLAAESGPAARFFLGSTAREVMLGANCPVIVCYRPQPMRKIRAVQKEPQQSNQQKPEITSASESVHMT